MESINNNVASVSINKPGDLQQKDKPQQSYNDLRELLNKKRQSKNDPKSKPPAEPRYNFLSDPLRENEDESLKYDNSNDSKYPQRNYNQYRGRSRGRGRGRVYYRGNNYNRNSRREDEQNYESTDNIANDDKFENNSEENNEFKLKIYVPNRTFSRSNNDRKYIKNSTENQLEQTPNKNETRYSNYEPRKNYRDGNSQYQQPQRNPHYRGRPFVKRAPRKPHPVNITVEYSVDSGARKCTLEYINVKEEKQNKADGKKLGKCVEVKAEENWDEEETENICDKKNNEDNKVDDVQETDEKLEPAEKN